MIYAEIDSNKTLLQTIDLPDGPVYFEHQEGCTYRALDTMPSWAHPTPTSVMRWEDDWPAPQWAETATLAELIATATDQIDAAGEALRQQVVTKRPLKADEYAQAETQARSWRAAGYAGDAPEDVASWAAARHRDEMTDQQAADDILAEADQYRALLSAIRRLRLKHMEDARHAASGADTLAAVAQFNEDLAEVAAGLK